MRSQRLLRHLQSETDRGEWVIHPSNSFINA
jgi:hypothetical protein